MYLKETELWGRGKKSRDTVPFKEECRKKRVYKTRSWHVPVVQVPGGGGRGGPQEGAQGRLQVL